MSESAVHLTRRQAIDFRLVRHVLVKRLGPDGAQAAAVVGLQDAPPGTAAPALAARADVAPEALDELVLVPSIRGAPLAVAERDLGVFTAGLEPPDEEAAKAVVGNAWRSLDGIGAMEALDRISEAVYESLRDGARARDDFHQALRERLPGELLWWCKGCGSRHVHPSLVARHGNPRRARDRRPRGPQRRLWSATEGRDAQGRRRRAGAPLRSRLRPGTAQAAGRLGRPDDLPRHRPVATRQTQPDRVRLLPNLDPLNAGRDRDVLVPDPALRRRIWTAIGGPGTVLVAGEVAGLWRPAKKGRKLLITVEPLGKLTSAATDELAGEIERLAPFRWADSGDLRLAAP